MSNTLLTPSVIAKESLMQLENNCVMGNLVYRGYEDEWMQKVNGWKKGSSITAKAPLQARVQDGETAVVVDYREEDITLTVNLRKHVARKLTGTEMTLSIDAFSERFLKPDMQALGNYIDNALLGLYSGICNQVGVPGTTPSQWKTIAEASAVMDDHSVPQDNRWCVLDPWAQVNLCDQLKGLLNPSMVGNAVQKAAFGNLAGFDMYKSQNVNSHTCGTAAGLSTNLVDGTASEGDTTVTIDQNGSWSNTVTAGDIFTVAGTNGVNVLSGDSTGRLRQFVINTAADATGNESDLDTTPGAAPWNIYSSANTDPKTLPYQTVDTLPTDNAAINIDGSASLVHKVNLAGHKNTLALFMVPVEPLQGMKSYRDSYNGFTLTVTMGGDIINYVNYMRIDVLFGIKVINPFTGCRIAG